MKIAVAGSAGIGKSSLAQALATALDIHYIREGYEPLFSQSGGLNNPPEILAPIFHQILDAKLAEQEAYDSFVVDRTPADLLNLAMKTSFVRHDRHVAGLFARCRKETARYELIVIPPWGVIPLLPSDDALGRQQRVTNRWIQLNNHAAIVGLIRMFVPDERILFLPQTAKIMQEWLGIVTNRLGILGLT